MTHNFKKQHLTFPLISGQTHTCIEDVKTWRDKNKLKLSENKTELLAIGDRVRLSEVRLDPLVLSSGTVLFNNQPSITEFS